MPKFIEFSVDGEENTTAVCVPVECVEAISQRRGEKGLYCIVETTARRDYVTEEAFETLLKKLRG